MSKTLAAIIVGKASKIVRRIVIPTYDDSEITNLPLHPGEQELLVSIASLSNPASIANAVQAATGVVPPSSRCAVVVSANAITGSVANIIQADPIIDSVPGHILILSPTAAIGDSWSAAGGIQSSV